MWRLMKFPADVDGLVDRVARKGQQRHWWWLMALQCWGCALKDVIVKGGLRRVLLQMRKMHIQNGHDYR